MQSKAISINATGKGRALLAMTIAIVAIIAGGSQALAHRSGAGAAAQTKLSAADRQYLQGAIEGDRFEIAGGKDAATRTQNAAVKQLADQLVKDHSASLAQSVKLAKKLGVSVPKHPSPSQQWELDVVKAFQVADFNRWYSKLEIQDHIQDIQEASDEAKTGSNAALRKAAGKEIPVLKAHLAKARAALAAS
jgi:putative membrane protein